MYEFQRGHNRKKGRKYVSNQKNRQTVKIAKRAQFRKKFQIANMAQCTYFRKGRNSGKRINLSGDVWLFVINEATRQVGGYGFGQVLTKHICFG
jgi:hypothetical protein